MTVAGARGPVVLEAEDIFWGTVILAVILLHITMPS
jgi:hypothetical protein